MDLNISALAISLSFSIFLLLKLAQRLTKGPIPHLPPSPWKLPVLGNIHLLIGSLPHRAFRDLAKKHGPLMHLQLGELSTVVVSSPRVAKEIMKIQDLAFATRPSTLSTKILLYNNSDIAFAPYGDYWRQMRKIAVIQLLSAKNVHSFKSIREEQAMDVVRYLQSSCGTKINLMDKILSYTSAVTYRAAFGEHRKKQEASFTFLITELTSQLGGFEVIDLFPSFKFLHVISGAASKLRKLSRKLDKVLDEILEEHEHDVERRSQESGKQHLIDVLLKVKESGHLGIPITTDNIKAVIVDIFVAGIESSALTTERTILELVKNSRVMEKVQAELKNVLKGKRTIVQSDLKQMSYLKMVIKESLRLHPPGPLLLPRECRQQCEIDGYDIPIKTKIIINAWAINRDPEFWSDADNFIPERFDIAKSDIEFVGTNFEYLPFGGGRRMCPGASFGLASVELFLAQLLYHFNWQLPGGMKSEDLDMTEVPGLNLRLKNSLYFVATPNNVLDD